MVSRYGLRVTRCGLRVTGCGEAQSGKRKAGTMCHAPWAMPYACTGFSVFSINNHKSSISNQMSLSQEPFYIVIDHEDHQEDKEEYTHFL